MSFKKICSVLGTIVFSVSTVFLGNSSAVKNNIYDGIYIIESAVAKNKVIDVYNASQDNYGNVQLFERNDTDAQKFYIHKLSDGYFEIRALCSGKMLHADGNKSGSNVYQFKHNKSDLQKWKFKPCKNGYVNIVSKSSGMNLDVNEMNSANGTNIQVWSSNDTPAQRFKLRAIKKFDASGYTISTDKSKLKVGELKELFKSLWLADCWSESKIKNVIDKSSICWGAYDKSGKLVGFIRVITDCETYCTLLNLVVDKSCRGKGLGTLLMRSVLEHKDLKNCKFSLVPSNEKTAKGYRLLGFRNSGFNYMLASSL